MSVIRLLAVATAERLPMAESINIVSAAVRNVFRLTPTWQRMWRLVCQVCSISGAVSPGRPKEGATQWRGT